MQAVDQAGPYHTLNDFIMADKLDEGGFATVFLAKTRSTGEAVALKVMDMGQLDPGNWANVHHELDIHWRIRHPRVVELKGYFRQEMKVVLVLEWVAGGSLRRLTRQETPTKEQVKRIFKQTTECLVYLHQKGVVHRDIKAENILLTDKMDVKVCDFGWATLVEDTPFNRECGGTFACMSPEALKRHPQNTQSDMWSLGVMLYELMHGKEPWVGMTEVDMLAAINNNPLCLSPCLNDVEIDLIRQLFRFDPATRLTAVQVLGHGFLKVEICPTVLVKDEKRVIRPVLTKQLTDSGMMTPRRVTQENMVADLSKLVVERRRRGTVGEVPMSALIGTLFAKPNQMTQPVPIVQPTLLLHSIVPPKPRQVDENGPMTMRQTKRFSVDLGVSQLMSVVGRVTESKSPLLMMEQGTRRIFGEITNSKNVLNK